MTCITIKDETVWLNKPAFRYILDSIAPLINDDEWIGGSFALEQIDINNLPYHLHKEICQTIEKLCYDEILNPFKDNLLPQLNKPYNTLDNINANSK